MSTPGLAPDAVQSIASHLAADGALALPSNLSNKPPTLQDKESYLKALLHHDPGVFLERHGKLITLEQRAAFESLRENSYEIDFYLKHLEDKMETEVRDTRLISSSSNPCTHCGVRRHHSLALCLRDRSNWNMISLPLVADRV